MEIFSISALSSGGRRAIKCDLISWGTLKSPLSCVFLLLMRLYAEFENGIDLKVYFSFHFWHAFCSTGKWNCFSLELEPTAYSHLQMAIEQRIIWNPTFPFSTPDYAWFFIYSVWYLTTLCCTISSSSGQMLNWMCSSSVHRCRVLVRWDAASKTKSL